VTVAVIQNLQKQHTLPITGGIVDATTPEAINASVNAAPPVPGRLTISASQPRLQFIWLLTVGLYKSNL